MKGCLKKFAAAISIALFLVCAALPQGLIYTYASPLKFDPTGRYSVSNVYSGFELVSKQKIENIESTAMVFNHVATGTKLLYLKNKDIEKSFGIGFRTPASDNTGVNHIIEHSVLCGSQNYPVKSPFLQMRSQSLGTFINALTFPDFTLYPAASKSQKDFENLLGVYLDAVFLPNIYKEPNIFRQEGWRYELESKEAELKINGIVYNEMKGSYSSPQTVMQNAISESLFPNTSYKWSSGGDPKSIPDLTYEKFLDTHKKYYSPSNCYIFLYGDMDLDKTLKFVNDNYLSKFSKQYTDSSLGAQAPFTGRAEKKAFYGISKDSDIKNKTSLSLNFAVGRTDYKELNISMQFLANLLMGLDTSPLKKALLESNIGQNVYCSYNDYSVQPIFSILADNTEEENKEKFVKVITETLEKIAGEGFDKDLIKSLFNYYEFSYRMSKQSTSKGVNYNVEAMKGWVYGNDPTLYVDNEEVIKKLKDSIDEGYFERIIRDNLLNNNHSSLVVLLPEAGMEEKLANELKEKLQVYKESLSEGEINKLVKETAEFKAWQAAPDSKEALDKIPGLTREDIDYRAEELITSVKEENGVEVLHSNIYTNGISNAILYFDASKVPKEKLHYLSLLTQLLGNVGTENYDYPELMNEMLMNTGGIGFGVAPYGKYKDGDTYEPKVLMSVTALDDNLPAALSLAEEILNNSVLTDKERFSQIIGMTKATLEQTYTASPGTVASGSILASLSESGKYNNYLSGLSYYRFICDINSNLDSKWEDVVKNLEEVKELAFNREGLVIGYTGDDSGYGQFKDSMGMLVGKISSNTLPSYEYKFDAPSQKQAFTLPVKTMDVLQGGNFKEAGYEYNGKMKVLQKILSDGYMMNEVRVKGGAYGGAVAIQENGGVVFLSYRDPNLKKTLDVYDGIVEYLKNFNADEEEMTNFIIGTIGSSDYNLSPLVKGIYGTERYLMGVTQDDLQKEKEEILSTTAQDIRDFAGMIEKVLKQDIYSVAGNENIINENADMFNRVEKVMEQ